MKKGVLTLKRLFEIREHLEKHKVKTITIEGVKYVMLQNERRR